VFGFTGPIYALTAQRVPQNRVELAQTYTGDVRPHARFGVVRQVTGTNTATEGETNPHVPGLLPTGGAVFPYLLCAPRLSSKGVA
jgi:hypothetical protein